LVSVWEDPDSLPQPEHLNQLQTTYDLVADRLPLLLMQYIELMTTQQKTLSRTVNFQTFLLIRNKPSDRLFAASL